MTRTAALIRRAAASHPQRLIFVLALLSRLVPCLLLQFLSRLPAFDSSAQILSGNPGSATLRWDAIHFAAIAKDGYQFEQQIAFQPGWPLLLRAVSWLAGGGKPSDVARIVRVGEIIACGSYAGAAVMLYQLTALISTPSFALTTALLYLIPPAPAVTSSALTEPIFALLTFTGFYCAVKRRFLASALFLAGATSVRATGVLAVGSVAWIAIFGDGSVVASLRSPKRLIRRCLISIIPLGIIISPFVLSQTYFYYALCHVNTPDVWCGKLLPLAYSHVQEKYWNVGLLNYWTPAQIPNIILALPVLLVSFVGAYRFFATIRPTLTTESPIFTPTTFIPVQSGGATRNLLLPFYIHSLALTLLLLFSAHTQIALRVCVTDPVIWWSLAGIAFRWDGRRQRAGREAKGAEERRPDVDGKAGPGGMTTAGKVWVWWAVVYGAISIVLWAGHYPPA